MRREELQEFDAFDEGVFCRSRTWLFLSYVVSFGAVAGSVWVLMQVMCSQVTFCRCTHNSPAYHAPALMGMDLVVMLLQSSARRCMQPGSTRVFLGLPRCHNR